jgi:hypothetical protein
MDPGRVQKLNRFVVAQHFQKLDQTLTDFQLKGKSGLYGMCGSHVSPAFTDASADNNPEYVTSQSYRNMLQTLKESGYKRVIRKALNSKVIVLKRFLSKQMDKIHEGRK